MYMYMNIENTFENQLQEYYLVNRIYMIIISSHPAMGHEMDVT